ncbi:uncharacterized protein [Mycetomoellerius zeteki]|uniref:uncharacterized protein n=1 Tax=Mycetomoellerius zeteki TaxID=64791 RepID=UPI00084EABFA|nr:PREDICTED: uncharacterized protein LOC108727678 [Trachymyrmex zeteki]
MLRSFICYFLFAAIIASFLVRPTIPLDPRITRGTVTDIKQHPYQLSLQRGSRHACGAVIVDNKWVLTAAHCVSLSASVYRLHAGSNDKYEGGTFYLVKKIVQHPAYNFLTIDYDIALLEIDGEIVFNDRVQPVKLPKKKLTDGVMVNVTGWGAVQEGGKLSPMLMTVSLPIVSKKTCQGIYKYIHSITDRMICAGYMHGGQDACEGDSGGPLTADGILYGIVSWGYKCDEPLYPGVYTNVVDLLWWIRWISVSIRESFCDRIVSYKNHYSWLISVKKMFQKLILLFCVLLAVLVYAVNTEKHEYVVIEDYPYHVSIQIAGLHVCSGAFIHESWIMTAASCVFSAKSSTVSVRVRSSYTSTDGDVLEIDNIVVHENFDKYVYLNDIALMKLKSPAEFGEKLLPVALPENEKLQHGAHCVVTGWKRTQGTNPSGALLAATAVAIVNQRTCKAMMPSYKPLSEDMLCANATRSSERCQGDLGAPLVSEQMLIGILSYGLGCDTRIHPDVYTRVSSYLPWIFTNTGISYK